MGIWTLSATLQTPKPTLMRSSTCFAYTMKSGYHHTRELKEGEAH